MPETRTDRPRRILIVGGGISGLAAAVRLVDRHSPHTTSDVDPPSPLEVVVCDAGPHCGGMLQTTALADGLVEQCADMFTTKLPWALELCRIIGFQDELIPTDEQRRGALVAAPRGALPVPAGFSLLAPQRWDSLWKSPLLSTRGKLRMRLEPWLARWSRRFHAGDATDESFQSFAIRHWGVEAYTWLIQPLVSGIFTADPAKLSMDAALTEFADMERQHGSLWRAAQLQKNNTNEHKEQLQSKGKETGSSTAELQDVLTSTGQPTDPTSTGVRYGLFLTPRRGMSSWMTAIVDWLQQRHVRFHTQTTCHELQQVPTGWSVYLHDSSGQSRRETFSAVILALPTPAAAPLLAAPCPALAHSLSQIEYASAAIVVSRFHRQQFPDQAERLGFGLVVPTALGSPLIATSFASQKFPGRCRPEDLLTRSFFGGALNPAHVEWDDQRLVRSSVTELRRWIPFSGEPIDSQVVRWRQAMPQYHVGHRQRIEAIASAVGHHPNLALAGNAYQGVGIPQCIKSGWDAADRVCS